jgi:hypothetical protein
MTLGSHQKTVGDSQNWITPKWVRSRPSRRRSPPMVLCEQDSHTERLVSPMGRSRMAEPAVRPYVVGKWIAKLAAHGNGIALLHARTEAEWFERVGPCKRNLVPRQSHPLPPPEW